MDYGKSYQYHPVDKAYIFWQFQPGENGAEDKIGNAEGLFDPCTPPHMDTSIMFGGQTGILSEGRKDSAWGWLESGNTTYLAIGIGMFQRCPQNFAIFKKAPNTRAFSLWFCHQRSSKCPSMINFENMHPNFRWIFFLQLQQFYSATGIKLGHSFRFFLQEAEVAVGRSTPLLKMRL